MAKIILTFHFRKDVWAARGIVFKSNIPERNGLIEKTTLGDFFDAVARKGL